MQVLAFYCIFSRYLLIYQINSAYEPFSLVNIGITHVFSCINICRVPRILFEHEAYRPSIQHHPRDPASVNAMKQTRVIVILAYFTLFQLNSHWKRCKKIKLSIFLHWISLNKMASAVYFRTSLRHNRTQRFRKQKRRRNDQSGPKCVSYITSCK